MTAEEGRVVAHGGRGGRERLSQQVYVLTHAHTTCSHTNCAVTHFWKTYTHLRKREREASRA